MAGWQELYDSGKFSIDTNEPSELVAEFVDEFPDGGKVIDIGCGSGRNAVYLASLGFNVDAFDIVDLGWHAQTPPKLRDHIKFTTASAENLGLETRKYSAALMMRLLQYLSPQELTVLTQQVSRSLVLGGLALATFVTDGVSETVSRAVPVFNHLPESVNAGFEHEGLHNVLSRQFRTVSKHIPFYSEVDVCELVFKK
jgi:SAM-dependent methyltransferase